jgi:uracil-DNA glycosylase
MSASSISENDYTSESEDCIPQPKKIKKLKIVIPHKILDVSEVTNDWSYSRVIEEKCPPTWEPLFNSTEAIIKMVDKILKDKSILCPDVSNVFNAYYYTPLDRVKVLIIGQDPYHGINDDGTPQATGLAFSTSKGLSINASLRNIYIELERSSRVGTKDTNALEFEIPSHGDLTDWAKQGVMLLNTSLTVEMGKSGKKGQVWMGLISETLKIISKHRPRTMVLLWGKNAQLLAPNLGSLKYMTASHPSPQSCNLGFKGCNHFKLVNDYLVGIKEKPINWNISD